MRIWFYVAKLGGCHPSARAPIDCVVYGFDVSDSINGLVFSGYTVAFVVLPWFIIGGICISACALIQLFRNIRKDFFE